MAKETPRWSAVEVTGNPMRFLMLKDSTAAQQGFNFDKFEALKSQSVSLHKISISMIFNDTNKNHKKTTPWLQPELADSNGSLI